MVSWKNLGRKHETNCVSPFLHLLALYLCFSRKGDLVSPHALQMKCPAPRYCEILPDFNPRLTSVIDTDILILTAISII